MQRSFLHNAKSSIKFLKHYMPKGHKARVVFSGVAIAAVTIPTGLYAVTSVIKANDSTHAEEMIQVENQSKNQSQEVLRNEAATKQDAEYQARYQAQLEQANTELAGVGLESNYQSSNAMPSPFTDQNFYNCIEARFKIEYPEEEIPSTGLTDEQLGKIKQLTCVGLGKSDSQIITKTAGLEKLTALTELNLGYNQIASIDISRNVVLNNLYLGNNKFTTIDISKNSALAYLDVAKNQLDSIDVRQNSELATLYADDILIKTNPVLQQSGTPRLYNFSNVKFINSERMNIPSTSNYSFNIDDKLLTISNPSAMNGEYVQAQSSASSTYSTYKLVLPTFYTINYDGNGGSNVPSSQECETMDGFCQITLSSIVPNRSGYKFLGWATNPLATTGSNKPGSIFTVSGDNKNITLYAIWAPARTLSYNANGGSSTPTSATCYPDTTTGSCSIRVSSEMPTRENYRFVGWNTDASATTANYQAGDTVNVTNSTILYAIWTQVPGPSSPTVYTLGFNANGGNGAPSTQTCASDAGSCNITISTVTPTRENYMFRGWSKDSTATTVDYQPGTNITMSGDETVVTLYAVWGAIGGSSPIPGTGEVNWLTDRNYVKGSTNDAVIRVDHPLSFFEGVSIDSNLLTRDKDYTAVTDPDNSNAVRITVKADVLNKLDIGTHSFTAHFTNNNNSTSTSTFSIVDQNGAIPGFVAPQGVSNGFDSSKGDGEHNIAGIVAIGVLIPILVAALTVICVKIFKISKEEQESLNSAAYYKP